MATKKGKLLIIIGAVVALLSLYLIRTLDEIFLGLIILVFAGYLIQSGQNKLRGIKSKKNKFFIQELPILMGVLLVIYLVSSYFNLYLAIGLLIAIGLVYFLLVNKKK